jgi:hypothetical protein
MLAKLTNDIAGLNILLGRFARFQIELICRCLEVKDNCFLALQMCFLDAVRLRNKFLA